ncbi:MAG: hypothetical protein AB8B63_22370 [Granulosicoccus sp.]
MYILLIWGSMTLESPQWYAVFVALIMSTMLLFWVGEATEDCYARINKDKFGNHTTRGEASDSAAVPSLSASNRKLDSLKAELTQQYAQFGQDQVALNRESLGCWHTRHRGGQ